MTSEEEHNIARAREAWTLWDETKGTDLSIWDDYMTDDVKLRSLADGEAGLPFTVERNGRDEIKDYLEGLTGNFQMIYWRLDDFIASGDRLVILGETSWTARETGKSFAVRVAMITRWRDGKMCEYSEFYDTARVAATLIP